jgi:hypothetical protein
MMSAGHELVTEGSSKSEPPSLPPEIICAILHDIGPAAWCVGARVCMAWKFGTALCWEGITRLSVLDADAEGRTRASFAESAAEAPGATGEVGWLHLAQTDESEISIACLNALLRLLPRVTHLAIRDVRLTGRPERGFSRLPGQDASDPLLAFLVDILLRCPHLESIMLQRCSGESFEAPPTFAPRARGGRLSGPQQFSALRALQISQMDGPHHEAARWLMGCLPELSALDLSWSDTEVGESLVQLLPSGIEAVNFVGCFTVGERQMLELLDSPSYASLVHISLPNGMPLSVALTACASVPRLETMSSAGAYSDSGDAQILIEHRALRVLNLSALLLNHSAGLELRCPELRDLELRQECFVFEGLAQLNLARTPRLARLDIRWNARLNLLPTTPMPELREALLEGCAALSSPMLYDLVRAAPAIEELEMNECDGLRSEPAMFALAFAHLLRSSPALRYTLPSGVKGVGLDVPSSSLEADFP